MTVASHSIPGTVAGGLAGRAARATSLFGRSRGRTETVGKALTWLCGGALAFNLLLVAAILTLLTWNGMSYFWQRDLVEMDLKDGRKILGEVWEIEKAAKVKATASQGAEAAIDRIRMKIGNRDVGGLDFVWLDSKDVAVRSRPVGAVLLERLEWGNFYGTMLELRSQGKVLAAGPQAVWKAFAPLHARKTRELDQIHDLEKGKIGDVNYDIEKLRLAERKLDLENLPAGEKSRRQAILDGEVAERQAVYDRLAARLTTLRERFSAETLVMRTADGQTKEMPVGTVLHALRPNEMGAFSKLRVYAGRVGEFIWQDPRESNTEGGIFPAIFGTVMMVFLMSFAVAPLGVLAALYLREYAKQGFLVRLVRIAVNNLAGVPSIVFGMFGLGFFVYLLGGSIDRLFFPESLPTPTFGTGGIFWAALTLALLTVPVVIVAAEEGLAAVPRIVREGSLALGATKFETIRRVVVPAAAPGILTGMILAMARAAGEVAPLMIVGMVKLAPTLPLDGKPPFLHLERKFMHLGFHIYDLGFQSPNVEATTPLVFATALLLIVVVTLMNLVAIALRNHLRRKYAGSAV
ncbi:MAG TPA: phosphate ABC transporter permease PstA [Thermoanaerobaculia bacterium]|nr:phosphate ABC transporter permease PstA [Thermoanaerobaculia bacterium]